MKDKERVRGCLEFLFGGDGSTAGGYESGVERRRRIANS